MTSHANSETSPAPHTSGLVQFFFLVAGLAALSILLAFLPIGKAAVPFVRVVVGAIFIATPVYAIFRASSYRWSPKLAVAFIVAGLVAHVGLAYAAASVGRGISAAILAALAQTGLMVWCAGLGALLATLIKERNLLIPVSLFLAGFDIFTVLTPVGPTRQIMQAAPRVFTTAAYTVPAVEAVPTFGPVAATAYIGPADFIFMAMFFVAIYRFGLRARQTLFWLAPTLIAYMLLVLYVGALPALVPIGLCVLAVNLPEFKLTKEEWASTGLVVAIVAALILWGATRPKPPPEPLPTAPAPAAPAP